MNPAVSGFYELRFKTNFLESKAAAFQDLFVAVMSKAHPGDFIACRPWGRVGDRKNDGYLKSERTLFQVYAPFEVRASDTTQKIEEDFNGALPYWQNYFDTWVFVHNAQGGLPPDVIAKLLELERLHPPIKVTQWGYEELLLRFRLLSEESLCSLYGSPPQTAETKKSSEARKKVELAEELIREGKHSDAVAEMRLALAITRAEGNDEEEVEILLALALLTFDRRGRGEGRDYFREVEKKISSLKTIPSKVIYLRARAAALNEQGDLTGAEAAYTQALKLCSTEPEDEKGNLGMQGCIVRSSLVHFLCEQGRLDEARPLLEECEQYAEANKDAEEGELFQAAIGAGIHLSLATGDEDGAILRIAKLEEYASTSRLANRIGGDLINIANQASHRKANRVALVAAEACIRVGQVHMNEMFLLGALYTEAMVIMKAGDDEKALTKAEALLDLCRGAGAIEQATQQLIAEIRRYSGDSQAAVDFARRALSIAGSNPENVAFAKMALARALNDNGETEEALKQAKEAWVLARTTKIPTRVAIDFLSPVANYASQLGAEADVAEAVAALDQLNDGSDEAKDGNAHAIARVSANRQLRERFIEILNETEPAKVARTENCRSLQAANSLVVRPLLRLWKEAPECISGCYDLWGRGNFERMLLNTRSFPNSFNVTIEVRSLEDVKKAVRLWGIYADFLILLWKGPTSNGLAIVPFPEDYEDPGGWGYMIAAGSVIKKDGTTTKWYPALGYLTMFPEEVAAFLATEALPFIQAGRLIAVPAVGVGCINPGHGPFEQLLAEAANAVPSIRWKGFPGTPIGYIPYSPDAPIELLAELAEAESDRLRKLRLLLLRRSRELRPDGEVALEAKTLSLEIDDALRDLTDRSSAFARKKGLVRAKEPLAGATTRFRSDGQALASGTRDSPFAPLLILEHLGYGWRIDGPDVPRLPARFEPQEGDAVGAWLAPPSPGWTIPTVIRNPTSD